MQNNMMLKVIRTKSSFYPTLLSQLCCAVRWVACVVLYIQKGEAREISLNESSVTLSCIRGLYDWRNWAGSRRLMTDFREKM